MRRSPPEAGRQCSLSTRPGPCNARLERLEGGTASSLTGRAKRCAASADAGLGDQGAAAQAGLTLTTVHLELVLHRAATAVRCPIVAQGRSLAANPDTKRETNPTPDSDHFVEIELAGRAERAHARVPKRLVSVDVAEPGDDPLVEESGLDRRPTPSEP